MKKLQAKTIYFLFSAVNGLMFTLAFTLGMVYQVRTVGLNPFQLVVVGTTLELSVFLFEIPTGIVADMVSRRASVVFGSFVTGVARLMEGFVPTYAGILSAQLVWGFGHTFISGALTAWITDEVGEEKVEKILLEGTQISSIAEGFGIVFAVLLSLISLKWPIILSGVLFIVLSLFMIFFMPETNFIKSKKEDITFNQGIETFKKGFGLIRSSRFLILFSITILLIGLSSEGFDRLYTPLMLENLDFNSFGNYSEEIWFGILRAGALLLSIGFAQIIKQLRSLEKSKKTGYLLAGMLFFQIIGVLIVATTHHLIFFFIAYWFVSGLRNTSYPLQTALIVQYIPSKYRATVLSMTTQLDSVGQISGGIPIGYIGTRFSLSLAVSTTTLFLIPVLIIYARLSGIITKDKDLAVS